VATAKTKKKKRHIGGRYPFEVTAEVIKKVEGFASRGLHKYQIARSLGIHRATWAKYFRRDKRLREAYKNGRAKGIAQVANKLFEAATRSNKASVEAMKFYLKTVGKWYEASAPDKKKDENDGGRNNVYLVMPDNGRQNKTN
jgi:predicted transcriptional regulator